MAKTDWLVAKNSLNIKHRVYLSLGSNQGDRMLHLHSALEKLSAIGELKQISAVFQTESWGYEDPDAYLNMVCELITSEDPFDLHEALKGIERDHGRLSKTVKADYKARTLDIDVLFYGNEIIHTPELIVPHPRIEMRNFVLVPMAEIAPQFRHPISGKPIETLLKESPDHSGIVPYEYGI